MSDTIELPVTAEQVQQVVKEHRIQRWDVRDCSICGAYIGYVFSPDGEQTGFDSACDCSPYSRLTPVELRTFGEIADLFNMQTTPGAAEKMWSEFVASGQPS